MMLLLNRTEINRAFREGIVKAWDRIEVKRYYSRDEKFHPGVLINEPARFDGLVVMFDNKVLNGTWSRHGQSGYWKIEAYDQLKTVADDLDYLLLQIVNGNLSYRDLVIEQLRKM